MTFGASNWVVIPVHLKGFAVVVDFLEEDEVQQPYMLWICAIQSVQLLESQEEDTPLTTKLGANFHPKPFYLSVPCGSSIHVSKQ